MGGKKHRLTSRKYSVRNYTNTSVSLVVSLPLAAYADAPVQSVGALCTRITSLPLPPTWTIASRTPLSICKLQINSEDAQPRASVLVTLTIRADQTWVVSFIHQAINPDGCVVLSRLPPTFLSADSIMHGLSLINSSKVCLGNSDQSFITSWKQRSLTLHNSTGITSSSCINDNGH